MMMLAVALLVLGLLLIAAELCFPTVGVLGVIAFLCIVGGVALAFLESRSTGMVFLAATVALVPAMIFLGLRLLPRSPMGKHIVARGFTFDDGAAIDRRDAALLGREGVVEALLRPSGVARLDGRRVDVMSRGEPIEPGVRVRVIVVEGNRVVVARISNGGEGRISNGGEAS
jgi:membrane-bound serine protease (ClpP class)